MQKSSIQLLVIIVAVPLLLFGGYMYYESTGGDSYDEPDNGRLAVMTSEKDLVNPSYVESEKEIKSYDAECKAAKKRNTTKYQLITNAIKDRAKNKLIEASQQEKLLRFLDIVYISHLSSDVQSFCNNGSSMDTLRILEDEVSKFRKTYSGNVKSAADNLKAYRDAIVAFSVSRNYVKGIYEPDRTEAYIKDVTLKSTAFAIVDNPYIDKEAKSVLVSLREHKAIGGQFARNGKIPFPTLCNNFKKEIENYAYYKNVCNCIDPSINTNPDKCDTTKIREEMRASIRQLFLGFPVKE